jgi:hypothetical protein
MLRTVRITTTGSQCSESCNISLCRQRLLIDVDHLPAIELSREFAFLHIDPAGDGTDLGEDLFWIMLRLSFICLCQIDLLSHPKDDALPGLLHRSI